MQGNPDSSARLSGEKSRDCLRWAAFEQLPRFLETRIGGTLKFTWQSDRRDQDPGQC
jgi:hypothetical protein